jgi:hypothetical protein
MHKEINKYIYTYINGRKNARKRKGARDIEASSKKIEMQKKIKIWISQRMKQVQRIAEGYERNENRNKKEEKMEDVK